MSTEKQIQHILDLCVARLLIDINEIAVEAEEEVQPDFDKTQQILQEQAAIDATAFLDRLGGSLDSLRNTKVMSNEREVTAEVLSRGSGRGANLLPAWMTHPDLSSQVVIGKRENQDHPQDHKQEVIPPTTEISTTVATEASIKEVTARAGRD